MYKLRLMNSSGRYEDYILEGTTKIEDILSYVYMSCMLSSPRLIYDYGEKVGRCKSVKEVCGSAHQVHRRIKLKHHDM